MISYRLLDAIGMLDDEMILDAKNGRQPSPIAWKQILSAAAVILVVFSAIFAGKEAVIRAFPNNAKESTSKDMYAGFDETEKSVLGTHSSKTESSELGFSEDEIKSFLEKNKYDIVGAIAAEYGNFDTTYKISTVGFYHVSLGESSMLLPDSITLPVFADNEIISCITVFKNNNETVYSVTSKGSRIDNLNKAVNENKNGRLAFFYVNGTDEIAVSSENKIYFIRGKKSEIKSEYQANLFENYATEKNTLSCGALNSENSYIDVTPLTEESVAASDSSVIIGTTSETTETKTTNITLDDILSKKISSAEWSNSYNMLSGNAYRKCSESQKNDIVSYLSNIDFEKSDASERKYGSAWYIKILFDDNSSATIVLIDETFYIKTPSGQSAAYSDKSGNTLKLISFLAQLK